MVLMLNLDVCLLYMMNRDVPNAAGVKFGCFFLLADDESGHIECCRY